ncbi:MAG: hypothetical protein PHR28_05895 [candidate division Zixibacteria bacterium]|nr:hypothetical protein [candidate division Zixibacteria bacterium]
MTTLDFCAFSIDSQAEGHLLVFSPEYGELLAGMVLGGKGTKVGRKRELKLEPKPQQIVL